MKKFAFWANLVLNVMAILVSVFWLRDKPTSYEAWTTFFALVTSSLTLVSARSHWMGSNNSSVVQVSNSAGGDIAGGNISK